MLTAVDCAKMLQKHSMHPCVLLENEMQQLLAMQLGFLSRFFSFLTKKRAKRRRFDVTVTKEFDSNDISQYELLSTLALMHHHSHTHTHTGRKPKLQK